MLLVPAALLGVLLLGLLLPAALGLLAAVRLLLRGLLAVLGGL
ncbi:hypothetical protein [Nonomuraea salmonea]